MDQIRALIELASSSKDKPKEFVEKHVAAMELCLAALSAASHPSGRLPQKLASMVAIEAYDVLRSDMLRSVPTLAVMAVEALAVLDLGSWLLTVNRVDVCAVAALAHAVVCQHAHELPRLAGLAGQLIDKYGADTVSARDTVVMMLQVLECMGAKDRPSVHALPIIHAVAKLACQTEARKDVARMVRAAPAAAAELVAYIRGACDIDAQLAMPALPLLHCMLQDADAGRMLASFAEQLCFIAATTAAAAVAGEDTNCAAYFSCQVAEAALVAFGDGAAWHLSQHWRALQLAMDAAGCAEYCAQLSKLVAAPDLDAGTLLIAA